MLAKVIDVARVIEERAPLSLAEKWDNPGLQLGDPEAPAGDVVVGLDLGPELLEPPVGMVVVHHPPIHKPLSAIRADRPGQRHLLRAAALGVAVYAAHTNLDIAPGGVNDALADGLGLVGAVPIEAGPGSERLLKLVVFVPAGHEVAVREAMAEAGAGWIGRYSHCTFQARGTGTFKPLEGTNPFLGTVGQVETADEYRLETILPERLTEAVVRAVLRVHPYEEVAYDLYPLANPPIPRGLGRIGDLASPATPMELARRVRDRLGLPTGGVRVAGPGDAADRPVRRVAVCGGSGADLAAAAIRAGAQALITGDVGYHKAIEAVERGLVVIDAGHEATEHYYLDRWAATIEADLGARGFENRVTVRRRQGWLWSNV